MNKKLFENIIAFLIEKYQCHTIILYGSYASGGYTEVSDVDLLCFSDISESQNETSVFENKLLDAWIYPENEMEKAENFLHIYGGQIILNDKGLAETFLNEINRRYEEQPILLSNEKKEFLKSWLDKMLNRSRKEDIEGNFRYHWMLIDSLQLYFQLNDLHYLGPKKSLKWLKENKIEVYNLFNKALKPNADRLDVEELINYITRKQDGI